jgi:hypothetical protein
MILNFTIVSWNDQRLHVPTFGTPREFPTISDTAPEPPFFLLKDKESHHNLEPWSFGERS